MWYQIFKFELQYRIRRVDTYVFFVFLLLFAIVGVDFVFEGTDFGIIKKNSPLVVAKTMGAISGLFMILGSMIMGVPVLRDFEYQIESLMYVNPIKKRDYILGRFLGSFVVLLFVFSGVFFGMILGEFMPWHNPNNLLNFNLLTYLNPFVSIVLPILFFAACLFFITGALSKNLVVVYTQGIIFFVIFILTKAIPNEFIQAVLDPFSLTTVSFVTESWSITERSTEMLPFSGALLYNKMLWSLLGVAILIFGYKKFNFTVIKSKRSKRKIAQILNAQSNSIEQDVRIPEVSIQEGIMAKWNQLRQFSWFYFISICKQPSFWAIVICGMIIILVNSVSLGTVYGVDSYPATYFIVAELQESSLYFFIAILAFYSGELIWNERTAKLNLIYDATTMSSFINLLGKYFGLILIYTVLMVALIISGVIFQTLNGYYNYEFQVYFYGFFVEILPFLALYTLIALFFQSLTNHKFVGIMFMLLFFIAIVGIGIVGYNHPLFLFGGSSLGTYSDMNGYGHFFKPYLFIKAYWLLFGIILLSITSIILVRGTETNFIKRLKASRNRMSKSLLKLTSMVLVLFIILGSYIFYNTNVLNRYWTNSEATQFRVDYEKTLKQFEYVPQPKIIDVNLEIELYPSERNYTTKGYYLLKNTSETGINEIHIQKLLESNITLNNVNFEGGATANTQYNKFDYTIYRLNMPLQPGEIITMNFKQTFTTNGFEESVSNLSIVENGTFFKNSDFPTLGYKKKYELRDQDDRLDLNLPKRYNKARRDDVNELVNARSGSNSDGINFEITIGTEKDQTAIAPGQLMKQWETNNRSYFQYQINQPMINFYAIVSARYEVKKDKWIPKSDTLGTPVNLEIYHHKDHTYNLDRMMTSMKASFDYFSVNFSPYQYQDMRIMEFPRYAEFAQSFPGTVPFSESIGFVLDIDDEKDVDMAFFVTAHELAHQWFGMQVEAANVQGQYFILETLAQYTALMVLKEKYSEEKVQQFLDIQEERYLEGKRRESGKEPSLALVENQEHIYYAKGIINMYELQKQIGEDQVNLAIKRFLNDWNTANGAIKLNTKNYATSKDLLGYFRDVTPDSLQYIIADLFEKVTPLEL